MKRLQWMTAIILAFLMILATPLQTLAAGQTQYISDISIGYGDDGKAALENEGYTVWQNLNANDGGNGSAVWIGYKTTEDANDAITDIALMNMKGGYSFDAYTQEIEDLNRRVSEQLACFKAAIEEFRTNYEAGNGFAAQALKIMNGFTDDESENRGIGDLFLDASTTDETLHRIFLEGNAEAIGTIEQALALACIEVGEENVLTRLEASEYTDEIDPEKNTARSILSAVFGDFHSEALSLQAVAEKIENSEGGAGAFFDNEMLTDAEWYLYSVQYSKYILLSETPFGDTGMSLLDFALLDEDTENENGEVLEDEYLEMLAQSMTDGQLGIVSNVGIMTVLFNAVSGGKADEAVEDFDQYAQMGDETVSVYYGVDRQLFEDTDGIALTSAALREKVAAEGNDFGKDPNANEDDGALLGRASLVMGITGVISVLVGFKTIMLGSTATGAVTAAESFAIHSAIYGYQQAEILAAEAAATTGISVAGMITFVFGIANIIAAVVLLIFAILQWIEKPVEPENIQYTEIPRVIVEKPDGEKSFIPYYAAKLAGAAEGETDSTKLYGDLNGLNGKDEWVALYYSKNPTLGSPITTDMLVSNNSTLKASESDRYAAVHMFGESAAANLNQYNTGKNAKAVYLFLRTDSSTLRQSGSVFARDSLLMSVAAFVVGAGLASAVTYCVLRKKKTQVSV